MSDNTPLHNACRDRSYSVDEIRRLIDEDPEAFTKQAIHGQTPLHLACLYHRNSPEILHCLLDRCPPEVIGICNNYGYTSLYLACNNGVSIEILRRMIFMYPKALRVLANRGEAPLHAASPFSSLNVIQLLATECPIVCLLNNCDSRNPYDEAVHRGRPGAILDFLLETTKQAALALVVFVDSALITVPPAMIAHVQRVIPTFAQQGFSMSYMSNNEPIRQALDQAQTLNDLLRDNDLQGMIKDEDYQDVASGVSRMIKASSRINSEILLEHKHHISILESVSDTPDCFYTHLRNNPSLCCRTTTSRVTTHRTASSPVHVEVPTNSANENASVDQETSTEESGQKRKASD
jgi:hypothetical protein